MEKIFELSEEEAKKVPNSIVCDEPHHQWLVPYSKHEERIELIRKCIREDRDFTEEEREKVDYLRICCSNCWDFVTYLAKECEHHFTYTCLTCNYSSKK